MSFISVEGLGPLADLARALGLLVGSAVQPSWFQDPGLHLSRMLRDPAQRAALLSGRIRIWSKLGRGTRVAVEAPLKAVQRAVAAECVA